ncbi:MAG: glycerate kinase [Alphaproteobacteria bacterium]|nr:glycerate kinase [Alphaproteobacteria bacterium]
MMSDPRQLLLACFRAAVDRAAPERVLAAHLPEPPAAGRVIVLGAGKAAAAMAAAVEDAWSDVAMTGLVVTRYAHGRPTRSIEVVEAGHPMPDAAGAEAAARIARLAAAAGPQDLVVFLASGGGSALLALPADGVSLDDKRAVNAALLRSGADIGEMNAVRKHLSALKGGRLAALAAPARLVTLAISDVPGDRADVIASGPTVPDDSTLADARAVLARYGIDPPASVAARLADPAAETPKPGDPVFATTDFRMLATPQQALEAAAEVARRAGVAPLILSDRIEGEAREVGKALAGIALQVAAHGQPLAPPAVLLSGGETTVTVRGQGRGGRNAEFLLGLTLALGGHPAVHALAADTDGIDGSEDNAGALAGPDSLARLRARGLDPAALLADNDAYRAFAALDDLIVTGPTRTNVNDFRAILIDRPERQEP